MEIKYTKPNSYALLKATRISETDLIQTWQKLNKTQQNHLIFPLFQYLLTFQKETPYLQLD